MPNARVLTRTRTGTAVLALLAFGLAAAGLAAGGAAPDPKTLLKVDASIAPVAAGKGTLSVRARLESGWHVNSHKPSEDFLIATEIKLAPSDGVRFGDAKYPEG